jgi:hypothetical protein
MTILWRSPGEDLQTKRSDIDLTRLRSGMSFLQANASVTIGKKKGAVSEHHLLKLSGDSSQEAGGSGRGRGQ